MNHELYNQRMDFVRSILQLNDLEAKSIEPVEYEEGSPFPYNNFIYLVTLKSPTADTKSLRPRRTILQQPGTVPLPANSISLIARLANSDPRTGLNNTNRVESEIAFMSLVRQALAESKYSHIVPEVYAWDSISSGQGFSIQQHMRGTMPHRGFDSLSLLEKSTVLGQMADILARLQNFKIPSTVDRFGGLKFNRDGSIVSAQPAIFKGGPCATYKDFLSAIFKAKLQEADENPVIQGWTARGVRARLDEYINDRLQEISKKCEDQKVLVHADLTTWNLLFDAASLEVTALLDFDFSYVGTVADEFTGFSFGNIPGGKLPGPYASASQLHLRNAMLAGFTSTAPVADFPEVQWDVAKAWDEELARAGAARPHTIPQFREIADIYWLQDQVSPFELDNPMMRKRKTAEELEMIRDQSETLIVRFLEAVSTP